MPTVEWARDLVFKVKVTGKLQELTLHLPKGDSTSESIHIISEREKKEPGCRGILISDLL